MDDRARHLKHLEIHGHSASGCRACHRPAVRRRCSPSLKAPGDPSVGAVDGPAASLPPASNGPARASMRMHRASRARFSASTREIDWPDPVRMNTERRAGLRRRRCSPSPASTGLVEKSGLHQPLSLGLQPARQGAVPAIDGRLRPKTRSGDPLLGDPRPSSRTGARHRNAEGR